MNVGIVRRTFFYPTLVSKYLLHQKGGVLFQSHKVNASCSLTIGPLLYLNQAYNLLIDTLYCD